MENTETEPLLGPASHSMYYKTASDRVQLVEPCSAMASPAIDDLSSSLGQERYSSMDEDSLRKRASSRSSGAGDDFIKIEVSVGVSEREEVAIGPRHSWVLAG